VRRAYRRVAQYQGVSGGMSTICPRDAICRTSFVNCARTRASSSLSFFGAGTPRVTSRRIRVILSVFIRPSWLGSVADKRVLSKSGKYFRDQPKMVDQLRHCPEAARVDATNLSRWMVVERPLDGASSSRVGSPRRSTSAIEVSSCVMIAKCRFSIRSRAILYHVARSRSQNSPNKNQSRNKCVSSPGCPRYFRSPCV
jgi:hypothetical protein